VIPYFENGYVVAPDGSKVLDGNEIISVDGSTIGHIAWAFAIPMWADDSDHLCGATYAPGGQAQLVIFNVSGASRTVAQLGPSRPNIAWDVIACSPRADRAVAVSQGAGTVTVVIVRLSTGARVATHAIADPSETV